MGNASFSASAWTAHSQTVSTQSRAAIFTSSAINADLDPTKFTLRESVDSPANPNSTPIIVAVDVTGSMGELAEQIVKRDLGTLMLQIYDRKPVTDPHIMVGAIGDTRSDNAPIQATQFEADVGAITTQIAKIYLEGNGGGNGGESYPVMWYLAANMTKCDAINKRHNKGYIFTVGDEAPHLTISKDEIKNTFGHNVEADLSSADLYKLVSENWNVYHLVVKTGSTTAQNAIQKWQNLIGESNVIVLEDAAAMAEIIVSTIQINEGADQKTVAASWDGTTALAVANATSGLVASNKTAPALVRL